MRYLEKYKDYKLCYVDGSRAYFTKLKLSDQWGDDWNDAPYEHNAGQPYSENEDQIICLMWSGEFETPAEIAGINSSYSVQMINEGATPWLSSTIWSDKNIYINAGVNPLDFTSKVKECGTVYLPIEMI